MPHLLISMIALPPLDHSCFQAPWLDRSARAQYRLYFSKTFSTINLLFAPMLYIMLRQVFEKYSMKASQGDTNELIHVNPSGPDERQ